MAGWLIAGALASAMAAERIRVAATAADAAAGAGAALLAVEGDTLLLGVDARSRASLARAGVQWEAAGPPPPRAAGYPGPDAVRDALLGLEARGAGAVIELGPSARGEELLAWAIGPEDALRTWRVIGGTHGDEPVSTLVVLELAAALGVPGALPPDTRVVVVPALNPDGLRDDTRENASGIDINRDHGHNWSAAQVGAGPTPWSTPEARAVRALADRVGATVGVTVHAGAENLGWPWNWTDAPPAGATEFEAFAAAYQSALGDPTFWVTQGAWWYPTRGDCNDWSYGAWGVADFTLEVSSDKAPPLVEAWPLVNAHVEAILAVLDAPGPVVRVVGPAGEAAPAAVRLSGGDRAWTAFSGTFFRPFAPTVERVWVDGAAAEAAGDGVWVGAPSAGPRPSPALLSRGGDAHFRVEGGAAGMRLERAGHPGATVSAGARGAWVAPLAQLAPGAWDLIWPDGRRAPRALLIGEADGLVRIGAAEWRAAEGLIEIDGTGFGRGTAAWALGGDTRLPVRLAVRASSDTGLRLDGAALEGLADPVDLLVWSRGRWLAVADLRGEALTDRTQPSVPPAGTVATPSASDHRAPVTSCASAPGAPIGLLLVSLALLPVHRRRSPHDALVPRPRPGASRL